MFPRWLSRASEDARPKPDQVLFEAEYSEHFAFVWRSLRRLGVSGASIDDAAQDVFIVALRRRHEFRGESSYRTWLFGVVSNVARDYRRKQQLSDRHEPLEDSLRAPVVDPAVAAETRQALALVDEFLQTLDDDRREVFILVELEQMTAPEVAAALGVKLNTVYSRLRVARERFLLCVETQFREAHEQLGPRDSAATRACP